MSIRIIRVISGWVLILTLSSLLLGLVGCGSGEKGLSNMSPESQKKYYCDELKKEKVVCKHSLKPLRFIPAYKYLPSSRHRNYFEKLVELRAWEEMISIFEETSWKAEAASTLGAIGIRNEKVLSLLRAAFEKSQVTDRPPLKRNAGWALWKLGTEEEKEQLRTILKEDSKTDWLTFEMLNQIDEQYGHPIKSGEDMDILMEKWKKLRACDGQPTKEKQGE